MVELKRKPSPLFVRNFDAELRKLCRVAAIRTNKTMREWFEEAAKEKLEREG